MIDMSLLEGAGPKEMVLLEPIVRNLEAGTAKDRAVAINIHEEDRLPADLLARFHTALLSLSGAPAKRVGDASHVGSLALAVPGHQRAAVAGAWRTFVPWRRLTHHGYVSKAASVPRDAAPGLTLTRPYPTEPGGGKRAAWITNAPSDGPDELRDRLGLDNVSPPDVLYCLEMDASSPRPVFIPSALDAGCRPPWRRPPSGHDQPWGLTRDLRTDDPREPELLTENQPGDRLVADRVGPIVRPPPETYLDRRLRYGSGRP